jgi:hypothetical protein
MVAVWGWRVTGAGLFGKIVLLSAIAAPLNPKIVVLISELLMLNAIAGVQNPKIAALISEFPVLNKRIASLNRKIAVHSLGDRS